MHTIHLLKYSEGDLKIYSPQKKSYFLRENIRPMEINCMIFRRNKSSYIPNVHAINCYFIEQGIICNIGVGTGGGGRLGFNIYTYQRSFVCLSRFLISIVIVFLRIFKVFFYISFYDK